jgi:hypothetical protein
MLGAFRCCHDLSMTQPIPRRKFHAALSYKRQAIADPLKNTDANRSVPQQSIGVIPLITFSRRVPTARSCCRVTQRHESMRM